MQIRKPKKVAAGDRLKLVGITVGAERYGIELTLRPEHIGLAN